MEKKKYHVWFLAEFKEGIEFKLMCNDGVQRASISQNMKINGHVGVGVSLLWAIAHDAGKDGSAHRHNTGNGKEL